MDRQEPPGTKGVSGATSKTTTTKNLGNYVMMYRIFRLITGVKRFTE